MSLQDLNKCYLTAQAECDSLLSHYEGGLPAQFMAAYAKKVSEDPSFCSYINAQWIGDSGVVQFTTNRTNKRIFFPAIGFLIAARLVPFYKELLLYRQLVVQILSDNGTTIDEQEDNNGNVKPAALGYVDASSRVNANEKTWLKKFLKETKNTPNQWWGKGKEIKRANDFFVSPLMKAARLNAETQSEIADVAKQLSDNPELLDMLCPKTDLSKEFEDWLTNVHKKPDGKPLGATAIGSYIRALDVSTKPNPDGSPASNHGKVVWHNIYQHLHGSPAPKGVFQIDNLAEFDTMFGPLRLAVNKGKEPPNVISQHFTEIQQWIAGQTGGAFLPPALDLYGKFLQWREAEQKNKGETKSATADVLTVALKMFADKRKEDGAGGWKKEGWSVNGRIREYFGGLTQAKILAFTEAQFEEFFLGPIDPVTKTHKSDEAMMWAGSTGSGWDKIKPDPLSGIMPSLGGIAKIQQDPGVAAIFLLPGTSHPKGFGPSVTSELLMKFHPDACFKHGRVTHEVLTSLGLIDFPYKSNYSDAEYKQVCGVAAKILGKMVSMKLPRQINEDGTEDAAKPDYLTVNEFIWFVKLNLNRIEKQVLEGKMVAAKHEAINAAEKTKKPKCDMSSHDDVLLLRLRAALRTKPFAILAGHSGTGKSRMVRQLAYMTCNDAALRKDEKGNPAKDPGNFCMVQVKPNWHDSGDLLGYYSELGKRYRASDFVKFIVKAYAYPDTPFFVCLDEMNLAPVEQYFAEYLSAIESRKIQKVKVLKGNPLAEADVETVVSDELIPRSAYVEGEEANRVIHYDWLGCELKESEHWIANYGLTIPRNLFVVGTVNMDESTNQFSRKVLDRAMTLEMTDADFNSFGKKGVEPSYGDYMGDDAVADLLSGKIQAEKLEGHQIQNLNALKAVLGTTSFAVAYRFANEYALYETSLTATQSKTDTTAVPAPAAGTPAPVSAANAAQAAAPATPPADGGTAAAAPAEAIPSIPAKPLAFDDMILMKVLPRISGEDVAVRRIFFGENGKFSDPKPGSLLELVQKGGTDTESVRKIKAIDERGGAYLSFWP